MKKPSAMALAILAAFTEAVREALNKPKACWCAVDDDGTPLVVSTDRDWLEGMRVRASQGSPAAEVRIVRYVPAPTKPRGKR